MRQARASVVRALVALSLTVTSAAALAHAYLQHAEPPANAALDRLPSELRLRYSEAVEPSFVKVQLFRNGKAVDGVGAPHIDKDGKTVRVSIPANATSTDGEYEVRWRIVAKDGHPTDGRFVFRVSTR